MCQRDKQRERHRERETTHVRGSNSHYNLLGRSDATTTIVRILIFTISEPKLGTQTQTLIGIRLLVKLLYRLYTTYSDCLKIRAVITIYTVLQSK